MDRCPPRVLSCRSESSAASFVESSWLVCANRTRPANWEFHANLEGVWAAPSRVWLPCCVPYSAPDWVVYSKRPFGGGRTRAAASQESYTHRVAISNHRLIALKEGEVTFRWRDSAHKNKKRMMQLPLEEFLRRFFLHVLPRGFVRIRHFGFFAHRRRAALLPLCFSLLAQAGTCTPSPTDAARRAAARYGSAHGVAEPWRSWNDPRRPKLRLRSPPPPRRNHYDLLFVISNLSRAGTPAPVPCPSTAGRLPTTSSAPAPCRGVYTLLPVDLPLASIYAAIQNT